MNSTAPVFKETVTKVHGKKVAPKGYVFLVATAHVYGRVYTASLEVKETISREQSKLLFASMWSDLKPKVQRMMFKEPKKVKKSNPARIKLITYSIIIAIAILIALSLIL